MGFISRNLGTPQTFELAQTSSNDPIPMTSGEETPTRKTRLSFDELELSYQDPINFNAINKSVQMIMAAKFKEVRHSKKQIAKKISNILENIGDIGNDLTFNELMETIFKDLFIYGNSFVELIFNKDDTKIMDLSSIDAKRMDYARTVDGNVVLDRWGKPVGYTLKKIGDMVGDEIPEKYSKKISMDNDRIFILAKRICHFKLYTVGDMLWGIGLLEPSYRSVVYKQNIEKGQANSIHQRGFSPLIAYVGSDRKVATPADIKAVNKELQKLNSNRFGSFADWVKVESLDIKQSDAVDTALGYLRTNQTASLGMPMAFASGAGEATNRATLNNQQRLLEFTLNDVVDKTLATFKKIIIKRICYYNKITKFDKYGRPVEELPKLIWGDVNAEDIDNKITQINKLLTAKNPPSPMLQARLEIELAKLMDFDDIVDKLTEPEKAKERKPINDNGKDNVGDSDI